jgi:hypothetical protein
LTDRQTDQIEKNISSLYKIENVKRGNRQKRKHVPMRKWKKNMGDGQKRKHMSLYEKKTRGSPNP